MHRKHATLTRKSGTELNWISAVYTRTQNHSSRMCTNMLTLFYLKSFGMQKNKILEGFPPSNNLRIKDKGLTSFIRRLHCSILQTNAAVDNVPVSVVTA